jgi:hypothetical protein
MVSIVYCSTDPVLHIIALEGHHSFIKIERCELQKFLEKQCDTLIITILLQVPLSGNESCCSFHCYLISVYCLFLL